MNAPLSGQLDQSHCRLWLWLQLQRRFDTFSLIAVVLGARSSGLPLVRDPSVLVEDFALCEWLVLELPSFPQWKPAWSPDAIKFLHLPGNLITDENKTCLTNIK